MQKVYFLILLFLFPYLSASEHLVVDKRSFLAKRIGKLEDEKKNVEVKKIEEALTLLRCDWGDEWHTIQFMYQFLIKEASKKSEEYVLKLDQAYLILREHKNEL